MKVKTVFVLATGAAIGFVAGSAAGRQRYEQLREGAQRLAADTGLVDAKDRLGSRLGDVAHTAVDEATQASRNVVDNATDSLDRGLSAAHDSLKDHDSLTESQATY